jgi:thiol-disulfide isomerase/thioredoxin
MKKNKRTTRLYVYFLCIFGVLSVFLVGCTKENSIPTTTGTTGNTPAEKPTTITSIISDALSPYSGKILAGNKTPYIEFNTKDYQKATTDGKVILLYFYSDTCQVCKSEEIKVFKAFNDMSSNKMIGFKVHYDDSSSTSDERQLAATLEVKEAPTKIILKDGKIMQRNINSWDINDYAAQMTQYLE